MSAPSNAEPLGLKGWVGKNGQVVSEEKARRLSPRCWCTCGWHGQQYELLAVDEEETLWCPQCRTAAWMFE